ncbi:MAG: divergent polysaccharide deacetylase family protein [Candidatus Omnitrophota bacterium]
MRNRLSKPGMRETQLSSNAAESARGISIIVFLLAVIVLQSFVIFRLLAVRTKVQPTQRRQAARTVPQPVPVPACKGRIAIVIDDLGYNLSNLERIKRLPCPVTVSVLPNLAYSARAASELRSAGMEVILHLPMEPWEKVGLEKDTLMTGMSRHRVSEIIGRSSASVGGLSGVSNHMGSRATEDPGLMNYVLCELKRRGLYFLDSYVSSHSVCASQAQKCGVVFYRRDVFIDNSLNPDYIKKQIGKLKTVASRRGQAIGIGHDRRATVEVLAEVMPQLQREGYRFTVVSGLKPERSRAGN